MWPCSIRSGPPQLKYCHNCHAPRLLLDNRIYVVTGTSFCVPSGRWGGAATGSRGGDESGCPSDQRNPRNRLWQADAMTAQIIMVLLHGSLKTWGEFLRHLLALAKRRRMRGYDAAKLTAACNSPSFVYSGLAGGAWQIRQTESKSDTMGRIYVLSSRGSGLFMWF